MITKNAGEMSHVVQHSSCESPASSSSSYSCSSEFSDSSSDHHMQLRESEANRSKLSSLDCIIDEVLDRAAPHLITYFDTRCAHLKPRYFIGSQPLCNNIEFRIKTVAPSSQWQEKVLRSRELLIAKCQACRQFFEQQSQLIRQPTPTSSSALGEKCELSAAYSQMVQRIALIAVLISKILDNDAFDNPESGDEDDNEEEEEEQGNQLGQQASCDRKLRSCRRLRISAYMVQRSKAAFKLIYILQSPPSYDKATHGGKWRAIYCRTLFTSMHYILNSRNFSALRSSLRSLGKRIIFCKEWQACRYSFRNAPKNHAALDAEEEPRHLLVNCADQLSSAAAHNSSQKMTIEFRSHFYNGFYKQVYRDSLEFVKKVDMHLKCRVSHFSLHSVLQGLLDNDDDDWRCFLDCRFVPSIEYIGRYVGNPLDVHVVDFQTRIEANCRKDPIFRSISAIYPTIGIFRDSANNDNINGAVEESLHRSLNETPPNLTSMLIPEYLDDKNLCTINYIGNQISFYRLSVESKPPGSSSGNDGRLPLRRVTEIRKFASTTYLRLEFFTKNLERLGVPKGDISVCVTTRCSQELIYNLKREGYSIRYTIFRDIPHCLKCDRNTIILKGFGRVSFRVSTNVYMKCYKACRAAIAEHCKPTPLIIDAPRSHIAKRRLNKPHVDPCDSSRITSSAKHLEWMNHVPIFEIFVVCFRKELAFSHSTLGLIMSNCSAAQFSVKLSDIKSLLGCSAERHEALFFFRHPVNLRFSTSNRLIIRKPQSLQKEIDDIENEVRHNGFCSIKLQVEYFQSIKVIMDVNNADFDKAKVLSRIGTTLKKYFGE